MNSKLNEKAAAEAAAQLAVKLREEQRDDPRTGEEVSQDEPCAICGSSMGNVMYCVSAQQPEHVACHREAEELVK